MGGPHLFGALLAEQVASSVGELTAIQLQLYPLRHVCGTGINGACRPGVVEVFEGKNLQFALDARVRVGTILAGLDIGVGDVGVVHAERREDVLANIVIPGSAGHRGDDLSSSHVEQIVIGIVAAETGGGLHETQPVDDFFARVGGMRPEEQITFAKSHAAAMREQVADGHFVRDVGIVHDEAGQTLVDRIVPRELAFIDQRGQRSGGESFCVGADAEHRELVDGIGVSQFAHAITFSDDNFAVFHDGDGHAGNVETFHGRSDVGREIGEWRGQRRGGLRGCKTVSQSNEKNDNPFRTSVHASLRVGIRYEKINAVIRT